MFVAGLICSFNAALRSAQEGLRRSEVNFRSLVTHAPYGVCRCDSAGILLDVNPALVAMLGYGSGAELVGRNLANLYSDSQQWFGLADYLGLLEKFQGLAADWLRNDRTIVSVRLSGRAFRDERNTIFFELFAEDVTERRALEQQLRQAQKMEAVGRLAGGIAHDFNNLLMVISGYSEFLLERIGDDPAMRGHAQEIANAAARATSLTRQLLAFSRKQMLDPKIVDLNSVVAENVKMLTRLIGEDIDLVMVPGPDIGAVKADPGQIEQVIMNLAVNARDAMPHGGKLTIETANVTLDANYARFHAPVKPGDYVMLAISDTGMGMDADTQAHIFEPFYTTKGLKGTGLGLSTVYGIVKQSEGYIWLYSEAGKGTSFKIYLPRFSATGEVPALQPALAQEPTSPGHETILLVEDEENLRRLARQSLENQGYTRDRCSRRRRRHPDFPSSQRPHSPAVDGRHHAGNERARIGQQSRSDSSRDESAVHVGLHGEPHWPQRHAGRGHHPPPEALYSSRTEGKGAGDARYSTPSGETHVCSFSSISSNCSNS